MWSGFDWIPDQDHGVNILTTLQFMLLQSDGKKLYVLPAWPKNWDVSFKLHAPYNTTVEGVFKAGKLERLKVTPESRAEGCGQHGGEMNPTLIASLFISVSLVVAASGGSAPQGVQEIILNSNHEYALMWWANGWRGDKVRCVQTSSYGMAMDVEKMLVTHFGRITKPIPYEQAVGQSNDAVMDLPSAIMELSVVVKDTKYTCREPDGRG